MTASPYFPYTFSADGDFVGAAQELPPERTHPRAPARLTRLLPGEMGVI
jgi:hypothetical protein